MDARPNGYEIDVPETVARARSGDAEAVNQLTRRFWDEVQAYLAGLWYPPRYDAQAEASDLAQKTFIKLPRVLDGYSEQGRFPAWLRRVAKFEYRTRLRSLLNQHLDTIHTMAGGDPADRDETMFATAKLELRGLVEELPEGERRAWSLWADGFTHDEIAAELGIAQGASYTRVSRAKDRLVRLLMARRAPGKD